VVCSTVVVAFAVLAGFGSLGSEGLVTVKLPASVLDPVTVNSDVTYRIVVSNAGSTAASAVLVVSQKDGTETVCCISERNPRSADAG
jgi:hypothetical protein